MVSKTIIFALAAATSVAAHGKVAQVTGDLGGNGTALAIQGGVVPGPGPNRKVSSRTHHSQSTQKSRGLTYSNSD